MPRTWDAQGRDLGYVEDETDRARARAADAIDAVQSASPGGTWSVNAQGQVVYSQGGQEKANYAQTVAGANPRTPLGTYASVTVPQMRALQTDFEALRSALGGVPGWANKQLLDLWAKHTGIADRTLLKRLSFYMADVYAKRAAAGREAPWTAEEMADLASRAKNSATDPAAFQGNWAGVDATPEDGKLSGGASPVSPGTVGTPGVPGSGPTAGASGSNHFLGADSAAHRNDLIKNNKGDMGVLAERLLGNQETAQGGRFAAPIRSTYATKAQNLEGLLGLESAGDPNFTDPGTAVGDVFNQGLGAGSKYDQPGSGVGRGLLDRAIAGGNPGGQAYLKGDPAAQLKALKSALGIDRSPLLATQTDQHADELYKQWLGQHATDPTAVSAFGSFLEFAKAKGAW